MSEKVGKVIEVFIPNGENIDSNKIGFKVMLDATIIEIIQEQNDINASLMKGDSVLITKQVITGKEFIDIEGVYDE